MTAVAAVLTGPRKFEHREFPLPTIRSDDGLLRVEANGLCGTDYEQYLCKLKSSRWGGVPIIPGHETIGWIEKIGTQAAKNWKVREGDRVCIKAPLPCGRCRQCRMAAFNRCERCMGYGLYLTTDVEPSLWGGYATHLYLHPDTILKRIPNDIPTDVMTLFNPLAGVVRWIYDVPNLRIGEHVLILGPGQRDSCCIDCQRGGGKDGDDQRIGARWVSPGTSAVAGCGCRRRCRTRKFSRTRASDHRWRDGRRSTGYVRELDRTYPPGGRNRATGRADHFGRIKEWKAPVGSSDGSDRGQGTAVAWRPVIDVTFARGGD